MECVYRKMYIWLESLFNHVFKNTIIEKEGDEKLFKDNVVIKCGYMQLLNGVIMKCVYRRM